MNGEVTGNNFQTAHISNFLGRSIQMVDVPTRKEFEDLVARVEALEVHQIPRPPEPTKPSDYTDLTKWEATFQEEFTASDLDIYRYWEQTPSGRWKTFFYFGDRVLNPNGERQYYMDKMYKGDGQYNGGQAFGIDPFKLENGILKIIANPSDPAKAAHYWNYPYTSGLITTQMSFWQQYGRFVMRAKLPKGKGLWPAFWLLPKDETWPPELDPLEFFGAPNSRGEGGPTLMHWGWVAPQGEQGAGTWFDAGVDLTADFHVFAIEWEKDSTRFFLDDKKISELNTQKSFNKPMYMLINLAVGGSWPENPDQNTKFPAVMEVDFVRAYRRK